MANVNPLLLVGAVIGVVTALLVFAYASVKDKKGSMGFERNMADGEIVRRLIQYAKPYGGKFILVGFLVLFSISYDIASPLIVGYIEELVVGDFTLDHLFASVAVYAGVLVFSMLSTYFQAVILQKVGQRIISDLREDLFTHIESLAHEQLNEIPVGKLVTRVTNDTNAISMMFTNLLVNLTKNAFVILGILVFSKYFYIASMTSYFTFFLMDKFAVSVQGAQYCLFAFLAASAAGTFIGGPLGDRIGRKYVIWGSILGAAPFTLLLPYVGLAATVVLSVVIGLVISSAFSAILVYATDLMPGKVGMIAGVFFGLMFGLGGLGSAFFGWLADRTSIEFIFQVSTLLPLLGVITGFLPNIESKSGK